MSSYEGFSLSKILSRTDNYSEKVFEEVNLPFDHIEEDYIAGEELFESLTSPTVGESMENYSIGYSWDGENYEIKGIRADSVISFVGDSDPYFSFEGCLNTDYSHMRVDIAASTEEELEELSSDLKSLEKGIEAYFEREESLNNKRQEIPALD